jgi:MGT family glycosyltransferase
MRALFYNVKGAGHVNPTLPVVRELVARGHEVVYTLTVEWRERLEAMGCRFRNTAATEDGPFTTTDYNPGRPFYRQLLPAAAALLPHLVAEARALRPDVIVSDSCAPWGLAVAKVLGLPGVCSVSTLVFDREEVRRDIGDPASRSDECQAAAVAELATRWGVDLSDRDIGFFYGDENIVASCEALNPTHAAVRGRFHLVGSTFAPSDAERAKGARDIADQGLGAFVRRDGRRRVYGSMGTVVGPEPAFFAPFLEAFGGRDDTKLLLSIGGKMAPEALGPLADNVIVRASVPQIAVLEHTDAFVTHAGANSMHEGLFHGVPLVCVPHMGDQPQNARRVAAAGAGVHLPPEISAARLGAEVAGVLGNPSYAESAARIARQLRTAGGLARAVDILERAANGSAVA